MLKRYDICRSITDVELIPKMCFLRKLVDGLFPIRQFCVRHDIFFVGGLFFYHVLNRRYNFSSPIEHVPREEQYPLKKSRKIQKRAVTIDIKTDL